jgi:ubiquinone/menaquinone biosynthesis C-methylase UbiE
VSDQRTRVTQCQKPRGWSGRFVLWNMNSRHSGVTDWGLSHVTIHKSYTVLDVGCGGGRTVSKLAAIATEGKVYGIDYSKDSVAFARKVNKQWIDGDRVEIQECSVAQLPFADNQFDLVTAIETHFWWPDVPAGMREILRVLKPGGTLVIIAEVYKGANTRMASMVEKYLPLTGLKFLTVDEHRDLFAHAGYSHVHVDVESDKGWICAVGKKTRNVGN